MPRRMQGWGRKRLMLHAHGGLVPESSAVQYVANNREAALAAEVYPLSFIWRSDAWSTIRNILQDAFSRRRDEGLLDRAKDFMLDRIDDTLEPLARLLGGKAMWDEMKENARLATTSAGGAARLTADLLIDQHQKNALEEIHLVGHSAGAIFQAHLAEYLTDRNVPIDSLTLWAPACTIDLFKNIYAPRIKDGRIRAFRLFTLDDKTERDDHCANIYHKSLLYLVSHSFEERPRIPFIQDGTRLLGLERDVKKALPKSYWNGKKLRWFVSPAAAEADATQHGAFDNDAVTLAATLKLITKGAGIQPASVVPRPASATSLARRRQTLDTVLGGAELFR
jgi:pimeloyl-ACP methyl ester carboxylesterase